jgi:hypothetical protein
MRVPLSILVLGSVYTFYGLQPTIGCAHEGRAEAVSQADVHGEEQPTAAALPNATPAADGRDLPMNHDGTIPRGESLACIDPD